MASLSVERVGGGGAGALLAAAIAERGSAKHPHAAGEALTRGQSSTRDLADAVHFLCMLHGRHPGAIDHAANRIVERDSQAWLAPMIEAFAAERLYLTRLSVAAGPLPSTPGAADSDAVILAQRHAIDMLAQSERTGCALGAAMALIGDWAAIRAVLDIAAARLGVEVPAGRLHDLESIRAHADLAATTPAVERALLFGAEQVLLQHRGLWDLLEARAEARAA